VLSSTPRPHFTLGKDVPIVLPKYVIPFVLPKHVVPHKKRLVLDLFIVFCRIISALLHSLNLSATPSSKTFRFTPEG